MSKILRYTRWFLGGLFFLIGLIIFYKAGIAGSAAMLLGVLLSPVAYKLYGRVPQLNTRLKKVLLAILLFFIFGFTIPQTTVQQSAASQTLPTPTPETVQLLQASPITSPEVSIIPSPTPSVMPSLKPSLQPSPVPTIVPSPRPTLYPSPVTVYSQPSPTTENTTSNSGWSCDCSKTCPKMSCAEAQFQLNSCGCSQRDGDNDGLACDNQCR